MLKKKVKQMCLLNKIIKRYVTSNSKLWLKRDPQGDISHFEYRTKCGKEEGWFIFSTEMAPICKWQLGAYIPFSFISGEKTRIKRKILRL